MKRLVTLITVLHYCAACDTKKFIRYQNSTPVYPLPLQIREI